MGSAERTQRKAGLTRAQLMFVPAVHPRYDAVFRQLPFIGFFLISLAIFVIQVPTVLALPAIWWGLAMAILATILSCFSTKLVNDGDTWVTIVPILDYVALGLICVAEPEVYLTPMILLSVIPALWLGSIEKTYGFVIVVVMSFISMLPSALFHYVLQKDMELSEVLSLLLLPTFSTVAAGTIHAMTLRSAMKEQALLYQESRLEHTIKQERESVRLLDSIVQAVGRGLLVIDAHGAEIMTNKLMRGHPLLATNTHKISELEKIGWFFAADKSTSIPESEGPIARAMRGENYTAALYWAGDPTKPERYALNITSRALRDSDETFAGSVIAFQDVTNFMDALEAKDTFVSTISHEFRTPLTSIMGYLELIRDEAEQLPDEVVHYLDVADRNTHRLLTLVTDLLAVAQSDRGDIQLTKEACDLSELVDDAVHAFGKSASAKDITVTSSVIAGATVTADPVRISQVVENLLSNAVKYTPAGGAISATLEAAPAGTGFNIVISDTGMGIPVEEQSQLFTKFYRALAVRNGSIPGIGLGLSICQKIIEAHGGRLGLRSQPGEGTTVTVFLPNGM